MVILEKRPNGQFCERRVRRCHSHHTSARTTARSAASAASYAPSNVNATLYAQSTVDSYCYNDTATQDSSKLQRSTSYGGRNGRCAWRPHDPCETNNDTSKKCKQKKPLTTSQSQYNTGNYCTPTPDPCTETQVPVLHRRRRVRRRQWHCHDTELQCQEQPKTQHNKKNGDVCRTEVKPSVFDVFENRSPNFNKPKHMQPCIPVINDSGRAKPKGNCYTPSPILAWPFKESEAPLYEVRLHKKYNRRSCTFEISHVTKTIHPAYAAYFSTGSGCHTQEDQTGASIRAAETADLVWRSFKNVVDTLGWEIVVQIPTTCTKTVQQRHAHHGWDVNHSANGALTRFNSAASVLQPSYTDACSFTVDVPALKEPYVANKDTLGTNTGWYPGVKKNEKEGRSITFFDEFDDFCVEVDNGNLADNAYETAVQVVRAWQHYSYVWSGGQLVIAGLEAEVDQRCMRITVTAPVVLSHSESYGCEDLGSKGLRNWFFWHRPNRFCKPSWDQPRNARKYYQPKPQNIVQCGGGV